MDSDTHQLENLAADPAYAGQKARLFKVLGQWMDETGDSVPDSISRDSFDRETGKRLSVKNYRGTPPGADRGATKVNAPGPR
jgi:hypothetical protein